MKYYIFEDKNGNRSGRHFSCDSDAWTYASKNNLTVINPYTRIIY